MEIYIVNTGAKRYHKLMRELNLKMLHLSYDWRNPIKGIPYAIDNGAFHYWRNNEPFNPILFLKSLEKSKKSGVNPELIICPDLVAQGKKSLDFSIKWSKECPRDDYYLAVQDGMEEIDVIRNLNGFKGLMVGGTIDWKLKTAEQWVILAHSNGIKCHIGRVGTFKRLLWARKIGADSIDSSTFVQGPPDGKSFKRIIAMSYQTCLDGVCNGDKFVCRSCALNKICEGDI